MWQGRAGDRSPYADLRCISLCKDLKAYTELNFAMLFLRSRWGEEKRIFEIGGGGRRHRSLGKSISIGGNSAKSAGAAAAGLFPSVLSR